MKAAVAWRAADGSGRGASEVRSEGASVAELAQAIGEAKASSPAGCAFLVLEVTARCEGWLERACEVAGQLALDRRVVVVVRPSDLARVDRCLPWSSRVGLILHVEDTRVAFQDLMDSRLDAVRFATDFVDAAGADLRTGAALDAMLRLARSLGLATLGPDPETRLGPWLADAVFDYVVEEANPFRPTEDRPSQFGFAFSR